MEHKDAVLLHMIGQSMTGTDKPVVTATDVAKWFNMTRQWANQKLLQMISAGYLERIENPYRSNAVKYTYQLTPEHYNLYRSGEYKHHYHAFIIDSLSV